jgi:hypothetical protein
VQSAASAGDRSGEPQQVKYAARGAKRAVSENRAAGWHDRDGHRYEPIGARALDASDAAGRNVGGQGEQY